MKFKIEIGGRGGEVVVGKVSREFYDFVQSRNIDISEYAWNYEYNEEALAAAQDGDLSEDELPAVVPEELQPFPPGEWFECDSFAHEYGASLEDIYISILDESDNIIHEALTVEQLLELGAELDRSNDFYINELPHGTAVFIGQTYEKGHFGTYEFGAESFDPAKLTLVVSDVDGWDLVTGVEYEGETLDNGDASTTGKGSDFSLILVGEE